MATCLECKKCYPDRCPAHKQARPSASYVSATPNYEPALVPPPGRRPSVDPNSRPVTTEKKPPRVAMSMGGWAGLCTFLGVVMCILSVLSLSLASFSAFFSLLFGSMPLFCLGKLFKCMTEILKNQVEILNTLDQFK